MTGLFEELNKDYRFKEGFHNCINCGTCTAICPAAEFYKYVKSTRFQCRQCSMTRLTGIRNLEGYELLPAACVAVTALAKAVKEEKVCKEDLK